MKQSVLSKSGKQENYTKLAEAGSLLGHIILAIVEADTLGFRFISSVILPFGFRLILDL